MSGQGEGPAPSADGQSPAAAPGDASQAATTAKDPGAGAGQAGAGDGTTKTDPGTEDTFFDPNDVPDELKPAYKNMQKAFSKKMQHISSNRQKIDAYESFLANPMQNLRQMASQYGLEIVPQGTQLPAGQQANGQAWEPQTWDEVFAKAEERIMGRVREQLAPVFKNVQQVTASNIERQLDEIDPEWRTYEEDMMENLNLHPTLVQDVSKLYKMSVPDSVVNNRARQKALKDFEDKTKAAQVHGGKSGTRTQPAAPTINSFNDAVNAAKEQLKGAG